jgi:hypothetical protein
MITTVSIPLLSALTAFLAAVLASVLTHFLTQRRDRRNEQRRQRATMLLNAFSALLSASNRPKLYEVGPSLERAIAEIQAIGTPSQIALAQTFASNLIEKKDASMDPLLQELRNYLRKELGAEPTKTPIIWLRIGPPEDDA